MTWEIPLFAVLGLLVGLAAARVAPRRFGDRPRMAAATGLVAAVCGGIVSRVVLGGALAFLGAAAAAVLLVCVASRPDGAVTRRHR
ncbi:hypothetical protein BIV57_13720 [Mangrovactinospora gilvigrisea]|uniref:Uncharacterized protein n=1 Tax=Mangrovactinospora gilvigrisea TaxID=1428644 RepID=A0A1J7BE58_9ACTN|nr:hypothetical protein [Mangrovactinospora gilvigrisea]OIV36918.1 hypothetical protein BIV57_13720 [Mangrovactinospora gilvigrisea]